jgi:hypothetical protein
MVGSLGRLPPVVVWRGLAVCTYYVLYYTMYILCSMCWFGLLLAALACCAHAYAALGGVWGCLCIRNPAACVLHTKSTSVLSAGTTLALVLSGCLSSLGLAFLAVHSAC